MAELAKIINRKQERRLDLYLDGVLERSFDIALGSEPVGDKAAENDGRTPEGEFYVCVKNPESKFHLSLGLSYPNAVAAEAGRKNGTISEDEYDSIRAALDEMRMPPQKTSLGGEIYIHGGGCASDWTQGCIALSDEDMSLLFGLVGKGCPVMILP